MLKYSVGIDVSKDDLHLAISVIDQQQRVTVKASGKFKNTKLGVADLCKWIEKHHKDKSLPLVAVMEATGIYYEMVALFMHQKGYALSVILPNKGKKYLQSTGIKSKNDSIDAKGLSRMGAEQSLRLWQPMGYFFYHLRQLTRHHQTLQEAKTAACNQLEALSLGMYEIKPVIRQVNKHIKLLSKQIKETEEAIKLHLQSNEEVYHKVQKVVEIKGVGIQTVAVLLAETNGFELFENSRQLVSYAGYDVTENQSGKQAGKTRISKRGNSRIRRALHLPAFGAVRWRQAPFVQLYNRIVARNDNKLKMKGYVAVQKKLLVIIYALWKKNEIYDPNYYASQHTREEEQASSSPSLCSGQQSESTLNESSANETPALHKVDTLSNDRSLSPLRKPKIRQKMLGI